MQVYFRFISRSKILALNCSREIVLSLNSQNSLRVDYSNMLASSPICTSARLCVSKICLAYLRLISGYCISLKKCWKLVSSPAFICEYTSPAFPVSLELF